MFWPKVKDKLKPAKQPSVIFSFSSVFFVYLYPTYRVFFRRIIPI